MTEKLYKMYARIVSLACRNAKAFVCKAEGIDFNTEAVRVGVHNMDDVVNIVERIMKDPTNADVLYTDRVAAELVIVAPFEFTQKSIASKVCIDSIIRSRNARLCQKQLVDAMMIEMYMKEAYEYDKSHPHKAHTDSAVMAAKDVVMKLFSQSTLVNFVFDEGAPHLEPFIKSELEKQAFDPRYAVTTRERNAESVKRKYASEFSQRREFFMQTQSAQANFLKIEAEREELKRRTISSMQNPKMPVDVILMTELYKGAFANLPMQNRRRKFVNLKLRNRDIIMSPPRYLAEKRQYAALEAMTKYSYIMGYYQKREPRVSRSERDKDIYYFNQEADMYRYIWGQNSNVTYTNGALQFDDGTRIDILAGDKPFETLHKVNTMYASLFGFTPDDMKGGKDWLYDSVRRAYTDEGVASYRLALIDAKEKGKV